MPGTLNFDTRLNTGLDLGFLMDAMESGLFSMDASGTESALFTMDASGTEFLPGDTVSLVVDFDGTGNVTGVSVYSDGALIGTATIEGAELSVTGDQLAKLPEIIADAYGSELALDFVGHRGDDSAIGTNGSDRFMGRGGDDMFLGLGGNDRASGGGGNDYMSGGDGNDRMDGGNGHDMLRGGNCDDMIRGGNGNDIIEAGSGNNVVVGGPGADVFVFDSGSTGRTVVRDYSADDMILFTGVSTTASGTPDGYSAGDTLADVAGGMLPGVATTSGTPEGVTFVETNAGHLRITYGDQTVILRNTSADEVELDQFVFTTQSADEALIDMAMPGAEVIGHTLTGDTLFSDGSNDASYLGFESSGIMFETFMGDLLGFKGTDEELMA